MKELNIAILGCGTVGGGVAQIILEMQEELSTRSTAKINLKKIVELAPKAASERFNIPMEIFCGNGSDLSKEDATKYIDEIINSTDIDVVVETIGGTSDFLLEKVLAVVNSKKHLITANKALLAKFGNKIYDAAKKNNVLVGFEAAVCGAIPIIKAIRECFCGDEILSLSGIMNGTSNYILSKMQEENLSFKEALKMAQDNGYAEADPTFDINGFDAGHKLAILIKLAFGTDINFDDLSIKGIEDIKKSDLDLADEIGCTIKLICYAKKQDGKIYAKVNPMLVKKENFLSKVNGSTNAVLVNNKYSQEHILVGKGAGSSETASSIVADMVFISRYSSAERISNFYIESDHELVSANNLLFSYNIEFETTDIPGITGIITTLIGNQDINIYTITHNRHEKDRVIFSIATMPCALEQIERAIAELKEKKQDILINEPKIIPMLD